MSQFIVRPSVPPLPGTLSTPTCVASDYCPNVPVPSCPVPLCVKHISRVYHFANDHLERAREEVQARQRKIGAKPALITTGTVYFIRFDTRIKIGFTTNLQKRMTDLHPDEILATAPGSLAVEKRLHGMFGEYRLVGEWFKPAPALLAYIARVKDNGCLTFD